MEDKRNQKIVTVAFVTLAFIAAIVSRVLLESSAATFGAVARLYGQDWFKHGVPVLVGILTFGGLQFNSTVKIWADEAVGELLKVVWPSRKDTMAMTIVVCVMLFISSIIITFFDFLSRNAVNLLLKM